jgi:hypothetical protein
MSHIKNLTQEIINTLSAEPSVTADYLQVLITDFLQENNLEIVERKRDDRQAWTGLNNA